MESTQYFRWQGSTLKSFSGRFHFSKSLNPQMTAHLIRITCRMEESGHFCSNLFKTLLLLYSWNKLQYLKWRHSRSLPLPQLFSRYTDGFSNSPKILFLNTASYRSTELMDDKRVEIRQRYRKKSHKNGIYEKRNSEAATMCSSAIPLMRSVTFATEISSWMFAFILTSKWT